MEKLLVVHRSEILAAELSSILSPCYQVMLARTESSILAIAACGQASAVLLDLEFDEVKPYELLPTLIVASQNPIPVITLCRAGEIQNAVRALKLGADDCISDFAGVEAIVAGLKKAIAEYRQRCGSGSLSPHERMVFASDVMKEVNYEITRLAQFDSDILIHGETGVGKDMVAREIHRRSKRKYKPFVQIPVKALSETLIESELFGHEKGAFSGADSQHIGKFEAANGGTIYIPEVSSLNESVQLKLLQFLQYKTVSRVGSDARKPEVRLDVRILLATNEHLEEVMAAGKMREDFYHRIAGVRLHIPALRDRPEDIEPLAYYFLQKHALPDGIGERVFHVDALNLLTTYRWPGNVRELENFVRCALVHSKNRVIEVADFPAVSTITPPPNSCVACLSRKVDFCDYKTSEESFKRAYFHELLNRTKGGVAKAAGIAGMTPQGFRRALIALGIERE